VEDSSIDYTQEEHWSVKRFVKHAIKLNEGKGPPTVTLWATWKGYPEKDAPMKEPWGLMKSKHKRQLKRYVNRNADLKKVVETYQLLNQLPRKTK